MSGASAGLSSRAFERILLIKPSSLGDVIHALPVLHGLRTRYPSSRIDWLIGSAFAPMLEGHPEVDELIVFDRRRFGRLGRSGRATLGFVGFLRELRSRRYDLAVDLQGLFRTGFLSRASGARVRIGFSDAREGAWMFYTHRIPPREGDEHAVDRNYRTAGLLGFGDVPIEFRLPLDEFSRRTARELLGEAGVGERERIVAVAPGARWETKVWLPERFAGTIDELQGEGSVRCVLVGGPDETALCSRIARLCRTGAVSLAGRTTLRQMAAVVERSDAVLCHDSAPMHVAAALGRPLVCLVGPTNPRRTGPWRRLEDVVRVPLDCSPCYLRRLSQCPYEHRCMTELSIGRVCDEIRGRLNVAPGAREPVSA